MPSSCPVLSLRAPGVLQVLDSRPSMRAGTQAGGLPEPEVLSCAGDGPYQPVPVHDAVGKAVSSGAGSGWSLDIDVDVK